MGSSWTPRTLSAPLLYRLHDIAKTHGGTVPLHGRLFAQWMHHAFPRECPFPHVSGTKNPQTPSEWIDETGRRTETSAQEMQRVVDEALEDNSVGKVSELMWHHEEELLAAEHTPDIEKGVWSSMRCILLIAVAVAVKIAMQVQSSSTSCSGANWKVDKHLV